MAFGMREDLYQIIVSIYGTDGQYARFTFDSFSGGDTSAKDLKYRPGNGTQDELSLGGPRSVSNVTVGAIMTYAMYQWVPWMQFQTGKAEMRVNKQPLDENGAAYGQALNYRGKLINTSPPKTDSTSDTAAMLTLELSSVTLIA